MTKISINFISNCPYFGFYISVIISRETCNLIFKSSILLQIVLYFSNSFSSSIRKDTNLLFPSLTLNVLTYPLVLGIIKTNSLIVLSKYPIKCLELVFLLTNFEIYMIKINIPNFYRPFCSIKIFFCYFSVSESHHYYAMNKIL